jgi:hypothetical protein
MLLEVLRQGLQLGLQLHGFRMSVLYFWAGNLQTMVPSHIQGQASKPPLQICQSTAAHNTYLIARVLNQGGQYLLHRCAQVRCLWVGHERCQRPIIIEEQGAPLRRSKALEYNREVWPEW